LQEGEWYVELVAAARAFDLGDVDLAALRAEEWETLQVGRSHWCSHCGMRTRTHARVPLQKKQAAVREKEAKMKARLTPRNHALPCKMHRAVCAVFATMRMDGALR
jgi:hypothetical protein